MQQDIIWDQWCHLELIEPISLIGSICLKVGLRF